MLKTEHFGRLTISLMWFPVVSQLICTVNW